MFLIRMTDDSPHSPSYRPGSTTAEGGDGTRMDLSTGDDLTDLTVSPGERRRYNRRRPESQPVPPYFSVFERMADALEAIVVLIGISLDGDEKGPAAEAKRRGSNLPRQPDRG